MSGQINIGTELGNIIYDICKRDDVISIVDIGTWNGLGSTRCIYQSIIDNNKKNYIVKSIEANTEFYEIAKNNIPKLENFTLINGRIIESKDIIDIDKCSDHFFIEYDRNIQKRWLEEDIKNYNNINNVLSEIPEKIDLLILDGGEFNESNLVAMTHALPGQPGHHHVNCKNADYWIKIFNEYGFEYLEDYSISLRNLLPDWNKNEPNFIPNGGHVKNTLMIFKKYEIDRK